MRIQISSFSDYSYFLFKMAAIRWVYIYSFISFIRSYYTMFMYYNLCFIKWSNLKQVYNVQNTAHETIYVTGVIGWTRVIVLGLLNHRWLDWFKSEYRTILEEKEKLIIIVFIGSLEYLDLWWSFLKG